MSEPAGSDLDSAIERTKALLSSSARDAATVGDGYLELSPQDAAPEGAAQRLMQLGPVSSIYERWWRPALGRIAKGVLGPSMEDEQRIARLLLGLRSGDGVLDVACGPGNFSRRFAASVGDEGLVVGLDGSRPMLNKAIGEMRAAKTANLAFVHADAQELPFRDASFDALCCFAALHMFEQPLMALQEMRRVLTPGGRIAILTSVRSRTPAMRAYESLIERSSGMLMFERDDVTSALDRLGFVDIQQRLSGFTQFVGGRLARTQE